MGKLIQLFPDNESYNSAEEQYEPLIELIVNRIHVRTNDELVGKKVALKIMHMAAPVQIKHVTKVEDITDDGFYILTSNLSNAELERSNASRELIEDLKAFTFEVDKLPKAQQTSTDVLELLFFKTRI